MKDGLVCCGSVGNHTYVKSDWESSTSEVNGGRGKENQRLKWENKMSMIVSVNGVSRDKCMEM